MCLFRYDDDPEPEERVPAGLLYVPVRPGGGGGGGAGTVIRLFRTPLGTRTAVGFTSAERLTATLGEGHPYIRLADAVLRQLCEPLDAGLVTVDPTLSAAPVQAPAPEQRPEPALGRAVGHGVGQQPDRLPVRTV